MTVEGFLRIESRIQRRWAYGICATMAALTIVISLVGRDRGPDVDPYLVVASITWGLCDLLTAFLLFAQSNASRRADYCILGAGYLLSGVLTFPYIGAYTGVLGTAVQTVGDQQLPATFFFTWHIGFAILAMVAILYRGTTSPRRVSVGPVVAVMLAAMGIFVAFAFGERERLPHFIINGVFQQSYWEVGIPLLIVTNAVSCVALLLVRGRVSSLRIWLAVAMFGGCLEGILNLASPLRFSYAWDFSKIVAILSSVSVMSRMLFDIIRMYGQIGDIVSVQSGQAAGRIRAIWRIATSEGLSEDDHLQMILDVAVGNILPGGTVFGMLSHLDSGRIVVDATSRVGDPKAVRAFESLYAPGTTFALDDDIHGALLAAGRTLGWETAHDIPSARLSSAGARSAIGATMQIGSQTHFVVFASTRAARDRALGDMDYAFVDVIAANIGQRFHQRSQRERMQYQLEHDTLTGLANRTEFIRTMRSGIASGTIEALILIDLDNFGLLNERVGHATCDDLLVEVAAALNHVDEDASVFRIGGDEFAVVLHRDPASRSTAARADAFREAFAQPFATGERTFPRFIPVLASLGGAELQLPMTYDDLMQRAAVALEESQANGGGKVTVYDAAMIAQVQLRRFASDELLAAMARNEFFVEYQPTVELNARSIAGAEALIRWNHPTRGRLAPSEFLDAAKRAGLMAELTHWLIARLVEDFRNVVLPAGFRCYFNVPAHVLEDLTFSDTLDDIMRVNPGIAARLGLEVTETDVMNQVERAIESLNSVRRLGLLVAVDDFGTGYSSMGYLKRLPIDCVKLDGSFIKGLPGDPRDENLAKLFLGITSQFSLVSVAEGVETEEQARWLADQGCMLGQGYLFSKPLPLPELLARIDPAAGLPVARKRRS